MTIIEKVHKLIDSIDTKGQVTIKIINYKYGCAQKFILVRLSLLDNSLCCEISFNKEKFDEYYSLNKEGLNKKIRLLTEECYRNSDCL